MTRCASRSTALPSWTFQSNSAARLATRRSFAWLSLTTPPTDDTVKVVSFDHTCTPATVCLATVLRRAPRLVPTRTTSRASPESASADTRRISFSRRRPTCLRLLHSRTSTRSARRPLRVPTPRSLLREARRCRQGLREWCRRAGHAFQPHDHVPTDVPFRRRVAGHGVRATQWQRGPRWTVQVRLADRLGQLASQE